MGEIKIKIPEDMEAAFEKAFPDDDKAAAVLHLIEAEIARRHDTERKFEDIVEEVLRVRQEPPYFTDEDIRKAREELRR
jgi:acetylornithine deacetylase/succinyl-diaminopimelate desuccinylase-like protein